MKVLLVHGVGQEEQSATWPADWATKKLAGLSYEQNPQVVGPTAVVNRRVPGGSVPHRKPEKQ